MIDASPKLMESSPQIKTSKTPLSKALAKGNGQAAEKLMNSMEKEDYNLQERWQITVFKNLDFNDEEFLCLSSEMQSLIYRTANNFNNITLVAHLNTLGTYTADVPVTKPCIVSLRMDIATTHQILSDYLMKLRQENRLVTKNEFQANGAWCKKGNFTRILGRDYILDLTKELNLKHIKVPEKKAVTCSNKEALSFEINQYGTENLVQVSSADICIYAQEIQRTNRFVSREEMTELFTLIEAANLSDLHDGNFIVAEDGIYCIDTEINSFCNVIQWGKMARLAYFMTEEDQDWFKEQIDQKIENQKHTIREDFMSFTFVRRYGKGAKQSAQEQLAKGIVDTATISFAVQCKQFSKQYKLVGSASPTKKFSFSVQDLH